MLFFTLQWYLDNLLACLRRLLCLYAGADWLSSSVSQREAGTSQTVQVVTATLGGITYRTALKVLESVGHGELLAFLGTDHSPLVQICLVGQQHTWKEMNTCMVSENR